MSTIQTIGLGAAANDKTGDTLRTAGGKLNQNFSNLNSDKAEKSNVLEKNNSTAFTPSANYHPATKKYVDDAAGGLVGRTVSEPVTLALTDAGGAVVIDSLDDIPVTIPPDSEVNFPLWSRVTLAKLGLGNGVFVAGEGVTMTGNPATSTGKWATAMKAASDTWVLSGEEHVLTWVDLLAGLMAIPELGEISVGYHSYDNGKIAVVFYDGLNFFVYSSADNGATWSDITPDFGTQFSYVSISGNNIVVVAYAVVEEVETYKIMVSDDFGVTWSDVTPEYGTAFTNLFLSGNNIVAIAEEEVGGQKVMFSDDLGVTWSDISPEYGISFSKTMASGNNIIVFAAEEVGGSKVMFSDDLGVTWSDISPESGTELIDGFLSGNNIAISVITEEAKFLFSDDLGDTWSDISPESADLFLCPSITEDNILVIDFTEGSDPKLFHSDDAGASWKEQVFSNPGGPTLLQANSLGILLTLSYYSY